MRSSNGICSGKAMERANNVGQAARLLNMSYRAFAYRWDKYGMNRPGP